MSLTLPLSGMAPAAEMPSSLDAEIQRLTKDDTPGDAQRFGRLIRRSVSGWEARRGQGGPAAEWELLHAYVARIDCDADFSSPVHAERLAWAASVFGRLLGRDGPLYAFTDPHRRYLVGRFKPHMEPPR
jgi:hypothetical protein